MESVTSSPILNLPKELQIDCFSALGEVDGALVDAFNMAMTNKKLYAIYEKHHLSIDRHIVVSIYSSAHRQFADFRRPTRPDLMSTPMTSYCLVCWVPGRKWHSKCLQTPGPNYHITCKTSTKACSLGISLRIILVKLKRVGSCRARNGKNIYIVCHTINPRLSPIDGTLLRGRRSYPRMNRWP